MSNHQNINQTSYEVSYGTPAYIMAKVRRMLGEIDLDPASSTKFNEIVKAKHYYTVEDNGLAKPWYGRVWLNHPFGRKELACKPVCVKNVCQKRGYHLTEDNPGSEAWILKLTDMYECGYIDEALTICYGSTSEGWIKPLKAYPVCLIDGRVNYLDEGTLKVKRGVSKGSVIFYLGTRIDDFREVFSPIGDIKV